MEQILQTIDDRCIAMPGVRNENSRGEVDPNIAPRIMNLKSLGAVPHDRQLPMHGSGLVGVELLQER